MKYREETRTELACYFLSRAGGSLEKVKLMKLMYLADRHALLKTDRRITDDRLYSMRHGPILSETLNQLNSDESLDTIFNQYIVMRNTVAILKEEFDVNSLDYIAPIYNDVLETVWNQFGLMDAWSLVDWTHNNLLEWTRQTNSCDPIDEIDIYMAEGVERTDAEKILKDKRDLKSLKNRARITLEQELKDLNGLSNRHLPTY